MTDRQLVDLAFEMLSKSYVPYSNFPVGAAILCNDGTVFTGCNVENAAYGSTICAERTALVKAVSEGHRDDFQRIAIVGRGMRDTRGVAGKVFSALAAKNINIKMIDQGSSELNIIIGVKEKYFEDAIQTLYDTFVTNENKEEE